MTKKLLELIQLQEGCRIKVSIQKSIAFLYTTNEQYYLYNLKNEIFRYKKLTKYVQDLQEENYKTLI